MANDPAEQLGVESGATEPRRFSDMENWKERSPVKNKRQVRPVNITNRDMTISTGGPHNGGYPIPEGSSGWNAGDIDFRWDGAIFIRNPYLADAIERHLQAAFQKSKDAKFFKIVRDEGWSGSETNIVC